MKKFKYITTIVLLVCIFGTAKPNSLYNSKGIKDLCITSLCPVCFSQPEPFANNSFPAQTGLFTVQFDVTPSVSNMDGGVGLSNGAASAYSSLACAVRFSPSGLIDARNGGDFTAATEISYTAGALYHVTMVVNMVAHTYNTYLTFAEGSHVTVATGYAFRTEQNNVNQLNNYAKVTEFGNMTVTNFKINNNDISGYWQGTFGDGAINSWLTIAFKFKARAEGRYSATLDSPDQGAFGIPMDSVIVKDTLIRAYLGGAGIEFVGVRHFGSDIISAKWYQVGVQVPIVLTYADKGYEKPKRSQEPKKPYPYKEEEISFSNPEAGVTLAGTLTLPPSGGPFPAVILIGGSGPQTRDADIFGHKLFLVLSDYLTRQGIAVLRYDKRGIDKSTGNYRAATTADFAGDVKAAVAYLKTRKELRKNKIGLIGGSEGGMIAPMVAAKLKDVAFIVMMAGPGVPCDEGLIEQCALIRLAEGRSEMYVKTMRDFNKKQFDIVKFGKDSATIVSELKTLFHVAVATDSIVKEKYPTEGAINREIGHNASPWERYFLAYDPRPALKEVRCPVLAINGDKDLQVSSKQNLPAIKAALKAGKNKDATVLELPGLNHLLQTASTGAVWEYSKIEETTSPTALKLIGDWILERCK
jgi:fermentation-respiration switch protein FrsA (DUF1100 family)